MSEKPSKGFTILELMVSMGVFSIMMLLTMMILRNGEEQARIADMKMNLQESARESLYRMSLELRESSPTRVALSNNNSVLTFQIPQSVDQTTGAITWSGNISYQARANADGTRQLIRTDSSTAPPQETVLANDIQSVTFGTVGSPLESVTFSVRTSRTLPNGRLLQFDSTTGEVRLRNAG